MREQIPLAKIKGREDNIMYRINDGYNLEDNDKTFFDKFNIMELLSVSRSMAASDLKRDSKMSRSAMSVIDKTAKRHYAA